MRIDIADRSMAEISHDKKIGNFLMPSDERLVDACIKRVRQKFKENKDFEIVTIRGLGYKGTIKNG